MSKPTEVMRFNEKLAELVEAGQKTRLAANQAMANPGGADEVERNIISGQIKGILEDLRQLQVSLEIIGKKNR